MAKKTSAAKDLQDFVWVKLGKTEHVAQRIKEAPPSDTTNDSNHANAEAPLRFDFRTQQVVPMCRVKWDDGKIDWVPKSDCRPMYNDENVAGRRKKPRLYYGRNTVEAAAQIPVCSAAARSAVPTNETTTSAVRKKQTSSDSDTLFQDNATSVTTNQRTHHPTASDSVTNQTQSTSESSSNSQSARDDSPVQANGVASSVPRLLPVPLIASTLRTDQTKPSQVVVPTIADKARANSVAPSVPRVLPAPSVDSTFRTDHTKPSRVVAPTIADKARANSVAPSVPRVLPAPRMDSTFSTDHTKPSRVVAPTMAATGVMDTTTDSDIENLPEANAKTVSHTPGSLSSMPSWTDSSTSNSTTHCTASRHAVTTRPADMAHETTECTTETKAQAVVHTDTLTRKDCWTPPGTGPCPCHGRRRHGRRRAGIGGDSRFYNAYQHVPDSVQLVPLTCGRATPHFSVYLTDAQCLDLFDAAHGSIALTFCQQHVLRPVAREGHGTR